MTRFNLDWCYSMSAGRSPSIFRWGCRYHHLPLDLGQLLLGLQLVDGDPAPGLELVVLLARLRVRLVHHAGAQLDKDAHLAPRRLLAHSDRQRQRPQLVHLVLLGVSRLAAAVEDVVPLLSVGAVEDSRQCLYLKVLVSKTGRVYTCPQSTAQGGLEVAGRW